MKPDLDTLGIRIDTASNFIDIAHIVIPDPIKEIADMKEDLKILEIEVTTASVFAELADIGSEQVKKIARMKEDLHTIGITVSVWNIEGLVDITPEQVKKVVAIKPYLDALEIEFSVSDIVNLSAISLVGLEKLWHTQGMVFTKDSIAIAIASQLAEFSDIKVVRELLARKQSFLEKYRVLSQNEFDELFKNWNESTNITNEWIKTWKYGYGEIKQTDLGNCYAYTGFNLLKNSNFFDAIVQTSLKKTPSGWEVTVPLGSRNWKVIKVSPTEIDVFYDVLDKETWKYSNNSKATSDTTVWMKILEIAYIKQYVLENPLLAIAAEIEVRKLYEQAIEEAKESFKKTWDFQLNGKLLWAVEGWFTHDWFEYMMGKDVVTKTTLRGTNESRSIQSKNISVSTNESEKKQLFDVINNGMINVSIGVYKKTNVTTLDGKQYTIHNQHAYALERWYVDTVTGEKVAVVSNPRDTHEKILLKREDCIKLDGSRNVSYINPTKLFTE